MIAIGFAFNDLDFVIHPFQLAGVDGVITVVEDTFSVTLDHISKAAESAMIQRTGHRTPLLKCLVSPGSGAVRPEVFELILQDHHGVDDLIER